MLTLCNEEMVPRVSMYLRTLLPSALTSVAGVGGYDAFFSAFFWHPNVSAESAAAIAAICKNFMVFPIGVLKML